ncbi:hypothetical protein CWM41_28385, partial [Escherichia coli]
EALCPCCPTGVPRRIQAVPLLIKQGNTMSKNFFQSGAFLGNGLSRFALNSDPVQLMESARASAEPPTWPVINNPQPAAQTNDNV